MVRRSSREALLETPARVPDIRSHDIELGREVERHRTRSDFGQFGDVGYRGFRIPLLTEQPNRRVNDRVAPFCLVSFPQRRFGHCTRLRLIRYPHIFAWHCIFAVYCIFVYRR